MTIIRTAKQIDIAYFNVRSKAGECQLNLPHVTVSPKLTIHGGLTI